MKGIEGLTLGRYELRQRLAQGGMAEVYLSYDRRVKRQVAIKVLYGRDEPFIRRFEREALAVGTLSHDHILPLYDFGEQLPWYYLVMPYVEGGTLRDYLLKRSCLTLEEAGSFLEQIASALQYAHDHGVVHRDVKPSNILLRPDGYAYLADFGLAKATMGAEALTSAGAMVGTPEYMAPEQSHGIHDYRSDIYSLGVILYQMLTGQIPFIAESPVAISLKHIQSIPTSPRLLNETIPEKVEQVILKAMEKDPNNRYQEANDFAEAYLKVLSLEKSQTSRQKAELSEIDALPESAGTKHHSSEEKPQPAPLHAMPILFSLQNTLAKEKARFHLPSSYKKRLRLPFFSLCALLLLILIFPLAHFWPGHQINAITSPALMRQVPIPTVNPTEEAQKQATARTQATVASQARTLAPSGFTQGLDTGHLLYANELLSAGEGWINDGEQCYFGPDGYHVQIHTQFEAAWCYNGQQQFSNFKVLAQARIMRGDICGVVLRLSPGSSTFYVLEINQKGEYRFVKAITNNPQNWVPLIDWKHSNALVTGYQQTNTFFIQAQDFHYSFYINGKFINDFADISYSAGYIGFFVGGDSPGGTSAIFRNLSVYQNN